MRKPLTKEEINARADMYEEAVSHLGMEICDSDVERFQAEKVINEIEGLKWRFLRRIRKTNPNFKR